MPTPSPPVCNWGKGGNLASAWFFRFQLVLIRCPTGMWEPEGRVWEPEGGCDLQPLGGVVWEDDVITQGLLLGVELK